MGFIRDAITPDQAGDLSSVSKLVTPYRRGVIVLVVITKGVGRWWTLCKCVQSEDGSVEVKLV
jgi:hypothetical protein